MSGELHIASCVVQVRAEHLEAAAAHIRSAALAEVALTDPRGRLVVLLEQPTARQVLEAIEAMRDIQGVITVNLVYQHAEDERALQEPIV